MSFFLQLHEACEWVRQGGEMQPEALEQLGRHLEDRARQMAEGIEHCQIPQGLEALRQMLQQALERARESLQALDLACREDAPELAVWAAEQALLASDQVRRLRQVIEEYSGMLCEESSYGDR